MGSSKEVLGRVHWSALEMQENQQVTRATQNPSKKAFQETKKIKFMWESREPYNGNRASHVGALKKRSRDGFPTACDVEVLLCGTGQTGSVVFQSAVPQYDNSGVLPRNANH